MENFLNQKSFTSRLVAARKKAPPREGEVGLHLYALVFLLSDSHTTKQNIYHTYGIITMKKTPLCYCDIALVVVVVGWLADWLTGTQNTLFTPPHSDTKKRHTRQQQASRRRKEDLFFLLSHTLLYRRGGLLAILIFGADFFLCFLAAAPARAGNLQQQDPLGRIRRFPDDSRRPSLFSHSHSL